MNRLHAAFFSLLVLFAAALFAGEYFQFVPQNHTLHADSNHVWFSLKDNNEKTGPEMYMNESYFEFFTGLKVTLENAAANSTAIQLYYENTNSPIHGSYKKIIPEN